MFGDLGQGLLLSLIGWAAWKFKKMKLGAIGMRIGITSAFFGLLYGSVFGNEELLTPFFTNILGLPGKPIHVMDANFTMTLLLFAIGIGVLLIIMSMLLNIYSLARKKHYVEMLVSHNGVAGMIFYVFLLSAVALPMAIPGLQLLNIWTEIFLIGVPLVLMFLKEPLERLAHGHKMFPTGFGGYFAEGFFELFEILLSYVTNTMSYLRVGGFVLSHAGMMLVVMSLMEMVGSSGWLVFILGNLFVMALEGLIVGIQVLRLEFYEMFSRYYTGDGIEFVSI
jgi:V/A-type H+-transporting ATPase subunit I